jgi:C4-dicarboxylate-specific signal transduction histidine kinase
MPIIGGWALYQQDINSTKNLIRTNINNQIDNLSRLIYPALVFDDKVTADEQIKGFSANAMMKSVEIWKKDTLDTNKLSLFSKQPSDKNESLSEGNQITENTFHHNVIVVSKEITSDDEKLGIIKVTRSLTDFNAKKAEYLQVGILSALSIFVIIILITFWYQGSLTKPLKELSMVAEKISIEKNYSTRANKMSLDEFGSLTDAFNQMLDSLESSNSQLLRANEEMEQRVERRTKELTLSNKRILKEMAANEIATQELIKTKDQLNQNEKLANVGQVSSSIAHELRNPMAAIRNSTYFLRLKLEKETKLLEHLKIIDREISRSDEVIQRLLEITKGEDLKKSFVDLKTLAFEAFNYADLTNRSQLIVDFKPEHFLINVDKLLFRQVLFNIFLNSIQAMPDGGKIIMTVSIKEAKMVQIIITDQGTGIEEHYIKKVFDPLFTDKEDGIGLGLSLCRDLISRHGGKIAAKSHVSFGTTIEIDLPS